MKLFVALTFLVAVASGKKTFTGKTAPLKDIKADSPLGMKILSQARRLDQEEDFTWVYGYSIKFQGCHHISQWNAEANGEEDVRIATKRLIRFRLCPSNDCTTVNAGGCNSGYGEYIIDMNTYLDSYFEAVEIYNQAKCSYIEGAVCTACNQNRRLEGDNQNRRLDEEKCMWDCYVENGVETICADKNPYAADGEEEEEAFELQEVMECAQWKPQNENYQAAQDANGDEIQYFMGPYCAEGGGAIYLGIFTDESCSAFADEYGGKELYKTVEGKDLPYGETNIVDMECISCKEPQEYNANGDDADDEDQVSEMCEQIYQQAGKCETNLASGTVTTPNTNACTYMEGIKIVRKNGVVQSSSKANKTASIFIGIFVVAFVLLAAYVYYLKTKLDRASINLSE